MTTNSQAINSPFLYKNNLKVSYGSATTLTISAGQSRNSGNNIDITSAALTLNAAIVGANGIDTGALAASTFYYVYQIGSSLNVKTPAVILSLSLTAPLLPDGYDAFDWVGIWLTNGSSQFLNGFVVGNGNSRKHFYDTAISVLSGGTSASLAAISLATAVPPIANTPVSICASFTPATANDKASFASGSSVATVLPFVSGSVAAKVNSDNFDVISTLVVGVPTIQYINSAASGATSVLVTGFTYFV